MFDYKAARTDLEALFEATLALDDPFRDQLETFIRVGEYPLAMDGIAGVFLENKLGNYPLDAGSP